LPNEKYAKTHQPCPDCGSSDALSVYTDGSSYCFSCRASHKGEDIVPFNNNALLSTGLSQAITERGITKDVCVRYGVTQSQGKQIYPYFDKGGFHTANKLRNPNKTFKTEGSIGKCGFFGQQIFGSGGKYVTIVEGELDALSAYQMFDKIWPVVSIRTGANSIEKDINDNYDFLNKFDNIILCLDNDDIGKTAANVAAELLAPKASIVNMRYKDPNEYLEAGKTAEFKRDWWNAVKYTPEGIVSGTDLWDELNKGPEKSIASYPYAGLNKHTYGLRPGELVTVCAGTGIGKSGFLREVIHHIFTETKENLGLMFLEESVRTTAKAIMGVHASKPFHLPDTKYTDEEYRIAFDKTIGSGRIYFFDHFGSNSIQNIIGRIRYMAKVLRCKYIVLDHVSILVSSQEHGFDERRTIDECMTKLRTLVQELDVCMIIATHLRRISDGSHEEGKELSLNHLRGSHSIGQLSDLVLGLERNGQADCPVERNTTRVRVIKNRFSGTTGLCSTLFFDTGTNRLKEISSHNNELV
tara:strand:+ start:1012 stop:2586 length:1575 start_codon:yes stop_codon:yes gene_type:complete